MYVIYALVDPRDNAVHYVGMTSDVYRRFLDHINCSSTNFAKNAWIMELRTANKMVIMKTLEEVESQDQAFEREAYWIRHFQMLKEPVLNISGVSVPYRTKKNNLSIERNLSPDVPFQRMDLQRISEVYQPGMSQRRLASLLGVCHGTAGKYIQRLRDKEMIAP